jgi:DoxX-like protein
MITTLWIAQVLLAAIFLLSGALKATMSRERMLATGQTGAAAYPLPVVRFTAVCELLAVIGLVLPPLVGVAPALVGWAVVGLAVVMLGAMAMHARLALTQHRSREWFNVGVNLVILLVCLFVAVGRL